MNIDYREFEKAGFSKEQTDVLKTVISVIEDSGLHDEVVKRELDASESRLENALVRELSKIKEDIKKEMHALDKSLSEKIYEVEKSLGERIHGAEKSLGERIHGVEKNLSFINRIGGFVLGTGSIAAIVFGLLHAHIVFN